MHGENIKSSKKEIEDTLDTLNQAFEKLLDSVFQDTAWDVSKVFGEKAVLDDVSYGVHQGDKIGIIGINGTGKSTILEDHRWSGGAG